MFERKKLLQLLFLASFFTTSMSFAKDYIIFSIVQEFPMGAPGEQLKKNYYVNLGKEQGIESGTTLNVYRQISRNDPFETKKRYSYNVKIGELTILHAEEQAAIGTLKDLKLTEADPLFEIKNFMVGDRVSVRVSN